MNTDYRPSPLGILFALAIVLAAIAACVCAGALTWLDAAARPMGVL